MKLELATKLAERIKAELAPMCEQIEIAGSVRRLRPECNDVDLVILPKPESLAAIKARCLEKAKMVTDGMQNFICRLNGWTAEPDGFQLDIFFAAPDARDMFADHPTNFGSLLLCRTGSKEHNIFLIEHAKRLGLKWNPYKGVMDAEGLTVLHSRTEEEIFKALQLEFVPPEKRER